VVKLQEVIDALKAMIPGRTEVAIGGVTGTMGALITILYGEWTNALNALLIAMVIDYVTGVLAAGVSPDRRIDYKVGLLGLAKKTTIFLIIALGHLADSLLGANLICLAVAYGYLANEGLSIIENAEIIGVPVPSVVRMAYQTIGEKSNLKLGGDTGGAQSTKKS
jgi:toxin secretion/phage lysis holin